MLPACTLVHLRLAFRLGEHSVSDDNFVLPSEGRRQVAQIQRV